jgi:S1-C subfamily serine protease
MALAMVLAFAGVTTTTVLGEKMLHEQVLHSQVRVRTQQAGGSGTVIYSRKGEKGFYSTYIITCHHVVEDAIKIEDGWDSLLKKQRKMEKVQPVTVEFFNWEGVPHGRSPLTSGATADIVAYSPKHDMALVHLRLKVKPPTAKLLPRNRIEEVIIGEPTWAVGCALGHDPILTSGVVTHQGDIVGEVDYWMSSAQIIFGNSGGAMYWQADDGYYFIGIPSLVDISGWGVAVTHCGYFSPVPRVYTFLEEQIFDFLVPGSKKTEAACADARKAKREREEEKRYK